MIPDLALARVNDWMIASPPVITPQTTVRTALRLLREHRLPALPVWAEGRLRGVVTEKALLGYTPSEATTLDIFELRGVLETLTVELAMEPSEVVTSDISLEEAALTMLRGSVDVVPVVHDGRLAGLLPWTALLAGLIGQTLPITPHRGGEPRIGVSICSSSRGAGATTRRLDTIPRRS